MTHYLPLIASKGSKFYILLFLKFALKKCDFTSDLQETTFNVLFGFVSALYKMYSKINHCIWYILGARHSKRNSA